MLSYRRVSNKIHFMLQVDKIKSFLSLLIYHTVGVIFFPPGKFILIYKIISSMGTNQQETNKGSLSWKWHKKDFVKPTEEQYISCGSYNTSRHQLRKTIMIAIFIWSVLMPLDITVIILYKLQHQSSLNFAKNMHLLHTILLHRTDTDKPVIIFPHKKVTEALCNLEGKDVTTARCHFS